MANFLVQYKCQGTSGMHLQLIDISTYIHSIATWQWYVNGVPKYNTEDVDTPMTAGSYVIQLVIYDGTHTCALSKTVNVPSLPAASFTDVDSQCITLPITFIATDTTNIISYFWDFGDSSYSALQNPNKVYGACYNGGHSGTNCSQDVTLYVTDKYGCQSSVTKTVYYFPDEFAGQTIDLSPAIAVVCANSTQVITVFDPTRSLRSGLTYTWSNHRTVSTDTIHVNQTDTYNVTVSDGYNCTIAPATSSTVIFNTIQGFISGDTLYCNNTYTNLNMFQGFQYKYYWLYTVDGGSLSSTTPSKYGYSFNQLVSVAASSYFYKVWGVIQDSISPGQYCEDTLGPLNISLLCYPPYPVSGAPVCVGYGPAMFIEPSYPGMHVLWNTGLVSDTLITSIPGTYTAEFIDTNGCVSALAAIFNAVPSPSFNEMVTGCYTYCLGDTPKLYVPTDERSLFVHWLLNDTVVSTSWAFDSYKDIYALKPGNYQLVLRNSTGCKDTSKTISISFQPCDSNCFKHANIFCSNCYYDSASGKRYIHLIISVNDTITSNMNVNVLSNDLHILNFFPNTFVPNAGTTYLNIDALVDSSSNGQYCLVVSTNSCTQEFCINTDSLSCTGVRVSMRREGPVGVKRRTAYRVINNKP